MSCAEAGARESEEPEVDIWLDEVRLKTSTPPMGERRTFMGYVASNS
jgi:hypothetical protein